MARDTAKSGKSETLTIRLDPKTRFILEYVSKLKGQTITTVVERAIVNSASGETVPDRDFGGDLSWQDFWDVSEGVRYLSMASRAEFYPTYEDEKRYAFCREHWPFFATSSRMKSFLNYYVDVLWPRIDEFIAIHDDSKAHNYFAAGGAMQEALRAAKLKAPNWPPVKSPEPEPKKPEPKASGAPRDIDDDIPF